MPDTAEGQRDRLRALLDELEREHGPIDPEVMQQVRDEWPAPPITRTSWDEPASTEPSG